MPHNNNKNTHALYLLSGTESSLHGFCSLQTESVSENENKLCYTYVVVQFYPWLNFDFLLLFSVLIYDNEYKTKENEN